MGWHARRTRADGHDAPPCALSDCPGYDEWHSQAVTIPSLRGATPEVRHALAVLRSDLEDLVGDVHRSEDSLDHYPLEDLDMHDVLVAYLILEHSLRSKDQLVSNGHGRTTLRSRLAWSIVSRAFARQSHSIDSVHTFVDVSLAYPGSAVVLARSVGIDGGTTWPREIADTDDVGRLTREVYDAAGFDRNIDRTGYLVRRLTSRRLRRPQRDFAVLLSYEWAGTLEDLVATAQTLRP